MSLLSVESLACAYGTQSIVEDVNFAIEEGDIACLLGPSGCGKTTILRALAGFNDVSGGQIIMNGRTISALNRTLSPEKRNMGMVFQDYALFPHLTVADNIGFGLRNLSSGQRREAVKSVLKLVRLPDLSQRYPHELSGGQQQRVALARALAPKPSLLLMDEPFSNLDTEMRKSLSVEVRDIIKEQGLSAIMVTHDQDEAFVISDAVGVLSQGRLQQWGSAESLYYRPENLTVARFVGEGELFEARCVSVDAFETELGVLSVANNQSCPLAQSIQLFVRPSEIKPIISVDTSVEATVMSREFMGDTVRFRLALPSGRVITSTCHERLDFKPGDHVGVSVTTQNPILFT